MWFASIVVAGAVAAAMSTADSQLHAVATLLTRDWYEPLVGSDVDEQTVTRAAKLLVPLLGVISSVIAIQQVEFILDLAAVSLYNAAQVFPILVGGLVWHRASRTGAMLGFLLGVTVTSILTFDLLSLPGSFPGFAPGFYGLIGNVLTFLSVSSLSTESNQTKGATIRRYLASATQRQWDESHASEKNR